MLVWMCCHQDDEEDVSSEDGSDQENQDSEKEEEEAVDGSYGSAPDGRRKRTISQRQELCCSPTT